MGAVDCPAECERPRAEPCVAYLTGNSKVSPGTKSKNQHAGVTTKAEATPDFPDLMHKDGLPGEPPPRGAGGTANAAGNGGLALVLLAT